MRGYLIMGIEWQSDGKCRHTKRIVANIDSPTVRWSDLAR